MRKDNHMDPTLKKHILKDEGIPNDRLAASHWVKLLGADESLQRKSQAQGSLFLFIGCQRLDYLRLTVHRYQIPK